MSMVPFRSADTPFSLASYTLCQTFSFSPSDNGWVSGTPTRNWFPTTQFLTTAFLCLTEATLVGSSTHDFTVRADPIMRRLGKARTPRARGVLVPLCARLSNGTSGFFLGAGGGSRTHFSHPFLDAYYGLLRDVSAARRLSRSAFGGQSQPRPRAPGNLERACQNRISLLKIK